MRTPMTLASMFFVDVDWFVESHGASVMGRGLELSARGARLPISCRVEFTEDVLLHVSLPARERMLRARCCALREGDNWVLAFLEVAPDDLQLLGQTLIAEFGELALPEPRSLATRVRDFNELHAGG